MPIVPEGLGLASVVDEIVMAVRGNTVFKIAVLLTAFPFFCFTIGIDRHLFRSRNWFLGKVPRCTSELRRRKADFFELLKAKAVRGGRFGAEPLIPKDAIMVYVDVKEGTAAEPDKNEAVARVDIAFRIPKGRVSSSNSAAAQRVSPIAEFEAFARTTETVTLDDGTTAEATVLHLFVKMSSQRSWPVMFKAVIAAFTSCVKEVSMYNRFFPMLEDYFAAKGAFAGITKTPAQMAAAAIVSSGKKESESEEQTKASSVVEGGRAPVVPFPRAGAIPFPIPTAHYATWSRLFDRNLTVLSCIDTSLWRPIADYCAVTDVHIIALVESAARLHAVTAGRVGHFASRYNPEMLRAAPNGHDRLIYESVCQWSGERAAHTWLQSVLDAFEGRMTDKKAAAAFRERQKKKSNAADAEEANLPLDLSQAQFDAHNDGEWFLRTWKAVTKRLERECTAVNHCDFRPGNMLFCGGGGGLSAPEGLERAGRPPLAPDCDAALSPFRTENANDPIFDDANARAYDRNTTAIVHLDWEGTSVAPLLFDFAYLVGLRADRAAIEKPALKAYLASLKAAMEERLDREGVTDPLTRARVLALTVPSFERAEGLVKVLYVAIRYVAWALEQFGGIGAPQGNSERDQVAWREAGVAMLRDVTADPAALAAEIGNGVTETDIKLFRFQSTSGPRRLFCADGV